MRKSVEKQKLMEILSEELMDFRGGNAIQHGLGDILIIGLLCILCNGNTFMDMEMFGELHEDLLRRSSRLSMASPRMTRSDVCSRSWIRPIWMRVFHIGSAP